MKEENIMTKNKDNFWSDTKDYEVVQFQKNLPLEERIDYLELVINSIQLRIKNLLAQAEKIKELEVVLHNLNATKEAELGTWDDPEGGVPLPDNHPGRTTASSNTCLIETCEQKKGYSGDGLCYEHSAVANEIKDQETLENVVEERIELLSVCCGVKEHEHAEGFCSACKEATHFEYGSVLTKRNSKNGE